MPESNIPDNKRPDVSGSTIEITDETDSGVDEKLLRAAVECVLDDVTLVRCQISIAIVDDPTIHQVNKRYLDHDYPTDVLSFPLERDLEHGILVGEIIVSIDTARENAAEYNWSTINELVLYVVHGCLHLIGHDDHSDSDRDAMRDAEKRVMANLGIKMPSSSQDVAVPEKRAGS